MVQQYYSFFMDYLEWVGYSRLFPKTWRLEEVFQLWYKGRIVWKIYTSFRGNVKEEFRQTVFTCMSFTSNNEGYRISLYYLKTSYCDLQKCGIINLDCKSWWTSNSNVGCKRGVQIDYVYMYEGRVLLVIMRATISASIILKILIVIYRNVE